MDVDLKGKRALVTGGSRGIGRATTLALARAGATVVACHRCDDRAAADVAEKLASIGESHRVVRADVTSARDVSRLLGVCRDVLAEPRDITATLDVLVNNAGVDGVVPFESLTGEEWEQMLATDLTSVRRVTREALPLLRRGSSVVNIGAAAATRGVPGRVHYGAAKAGVSGFTRALAKELGPRGIRVNTVAPGIVDTEGTASRNGDGRSTGHGPPPALRAHIASMTALGRLATPDDVAGVVVFLASRLSSYVTGATVGVDGGI